MSRQVVIGGRVAFILMCAFYIVTKLFDVGVAGSFAITAVIGCAVALLLVWVSQR